VTIAGLLGGQDILKALGPVREGDVVVLPAEALNSDDTFIDDLPMQAFRDALPDVEIRTGHDLIDALASA